MFVQLRSLIGSLLLSLFQFHIIFWLVSRSGWWLFQAHIFFISIFPLLSSMFENQSTLAWSQASDHSQYTFCFQPNFPEVRLSRHIVCFENYQRFYGQSFYWTFCHYITDLQLYNLQYLSSYHLSSNHEANDTHFRWL